MVNIFQFIFNQISEFLPDNWNRLVFRADYTENSYSVKFYINDGNQTISCFELPNVKKEQLIKTFIRIDSELSKERVSMCKEEKWTVMTMCVDSNGHIKTDFDYTDISENYIDYMSSWEQKFL